MTCKIGYDHVAGRPTSLVCETSEAFTHLLHHPLDFCRRCGPANFGGHVQPTYSYPWPGRHSFHRAWGRRRWRWGRRFGVRRIRHGAAYGYVELERGSGFAAWLQFDFPTEKKLMRLVRARRFSQEAATLHVRDTKPLQIFFCCTTPSIQAWRPRLLGAAQPVH